MVKPQPGDSRSEVAPNGNVHVQCPNGHSVWIKPGKSVSCEWSIKDQSWIHPIHD